MEELNRHLDEIRRNFLSDAPNAPRVKKTVRAVNDAVNGMAVAIMVGGVIIILLVGIPLIFKTPLLAQKFSDRFVYTDAERHLYSQLVSDNQKVILMQIEHERNLQRETESLKALASQLELQNHALAARIAAKKH